MDSRTLKIVRVLKIVTIMYSMYMMYIETSKRLRRKRSVRPVNLASNEFGFHETGILKDEEHFFKATRMSVLKFHTLLSFLKGKLERFSRRAPINEETRLALTLMYLSQGCSPQFLAWSHKIDVSTVREVVYDTCNVLWTELHDIYVAQPNQMEWKEISNRFYIKTGMPHCLGAIGGKQINIDCPVRSGPRKNYSIALMAACDSNYTFTCVDVCPLGNDNDGGIFSRSTFGKMILKGHLDIPTDDKIPGTDTNFQYYFAGNSTFPLKRNLMRPYPGKSLSTEKANFNKKLSGARVYIENTFGILSNRWRVLHNNIHAAPKNVDKIVLAIIVLHNYLMRDVDSGYFSEELVDHVENGVGVSGTWRESHTALSSCRVSQANRSSSNAFYDREALANILFDN